MEAAGLDGNRRTNSRRPREMRHRVVVGPEVVRPPFWDVHTLTFGRARLLWTDGQIVLDHW